MLKNFFKTAFRNLVRNKTYTFINIFGLALGISSALVLFKFINYHKSFDTHHSNYEKLYRFVRHEISANSVDRDMGVAVPFAAAFANDYPDVGKVAIVQYAKEGQFTVTNELGNQTKYTEDGGVGFVESSFLELFDVALIAGNKETALENPGHVILSTSLVEKYFGYTGTNVATALGKKLRYDNKIDLIVSGVMEDNPKNTDMPLSALVTFASADTIFPLFDKNNWGSVSSSTNVYLLKNEAVSEEDIEARLVDLVAKYLPDETETEEIYLQPLSDIHFNQAYDTQGGNTISSQLMWGCAITGIILILTACINFINLATAQAVKRAKEVGVRKVMGGSKVQLTAQFMSETFLITIISVILSLGIAELVLNRLDWLLDYELTLDLLSDPIMLLYLGIIIVTVTLMAGLYPSFVLSSLNPVAAMKRSKMAGVSGKFNLRRGLVIGQFFISQSLIICTLVVISQMKHFYQADMGFTRESIVSFNMPEPGTRSGQLLRNRLMALPNIEALSFHVGSPLSENNLGSNFNYDPLANDTDFDAQFKIIDDHYLDLFDLKLLAGQNLSASDTILKKALITEKVVRMLGFESPEEAIGVKVRTGFNGEKTIVGVVNDFHAYSLKSEIAPLFLIGYPGFNYEGAIRFVGDEDSYKSTIAAVEREWYEVFPDYNFEPYLFEDRIAEKYEQEADTLILFQVFSGIAIFIGCLGLYGLVAFMANQKNKEIGVRKVLGASVMQIVSIFSKELLLLIAISFLFAAPLGYYFMNQWLQGFEYNISIEAWMFLVAIAFTFFIGGLTTGFRSLRAAMANPVDSLRSE
ncbi:MAG: FtsX-like permease family protein [Roseivirga sp.]|nr:FtsX-like permease family protein [Roseivirga sp.]